MNSLGDTPIFSDLDGNRRYWKIEVGPSNLEKTSFTSSHGLYHFTRMPFCSKMSLAPFSPS